MQSANTYDLTRFGLKEMALCGRGLRACTDSARTMEEAAEQVVDFLYERFRGADGERQCVLVRFFKTHELGGLDEPATRFAHDMMSRMAVPSIVPDMRCLVLLGTSGDEEEWRSRHASRGHHAIPLPSAEMISRSPMIAQLVRQLGLDVRASDVPSFDLMVDPEHRSYNVFYVPEALGSEHIPAQRDFVERYGIRSVIGLGGLLPRGNMFAVVMFTRVAIPASTAALFNPIGLNTKIAVASLVDTVFRETAVEMAS
jgi:hypothetical protein